MLLLLLLTALGRPLIDSREAIAPTTHALKKLTFPTRQRRQELSVRLHSPRPSCAR